MTTALELAKNLYDIADELTNEEYHLCNEAANELIRLSTELEEVKRINAELVEALEICKAEAGVPETVWKTSKKALEKAKQQTKETK